MIDTVGTGCRGHFLEEREISALGVEFTNDADPRLLNPDYLQTISRSMLTSLATREQQPEQNWVVDRQQCRTWVDDC